MQLPNALPVHTTPQAPGYHVEEREANRLGDTGRYIRLAGKFHLDLAAATRNSALEQHLRRVVSQTSLMVALYEVPGTNTCSVYEHLEILQAIEAGDYNSAERLMEEHLLGCERQLHLSDEEPLVTDLAQALNPVSPQVMPSRPNGMQIAYSND